MIVRTIREWEKEFMRHPKPMCATFQSRSPLDCSMVIGPKYATVWEQHCGYRWIELNSIRSDRPIPSHPIGNCSWLLARTTRILSKAERDVNRPDLLPAKTKRKKHGPLKNNRFVSGTIRIVTKDIEAVSVRHFRFKRHTQPMVFDPTKILARQR